MHAEIKDEVAKFAKEYEKVPMQIKRGLPKQQLKGAEGGKPVYYMEEEAN